MSDLHNIIHLAPALNTTAITTNTTTAGVIIDMQGYGAVEFAIQSATLTDGAYTPLIQEGSLSNLSDATTVAAVDLLGTIASATFALTDDNVVKKICYIGSKRYVRLSIVSTSVTSGGSISAIAIQGKARDFPVA
jgi:hypothetical protein